MVSFLLFYIITKTCLYNFDFYIVKLGFTGVYIIFLISAQNIDCGYSLELPHCGSFNEYPQSMFWAETWKISEFLSENFHFLVVKFSVYLNGLVFLMFNIKTAPLIRQLLGSPKDGLNWNFTAYASCHWQGQITKESNRKELFFLDHDISSHQRYEVSWKYSRGLKNYRHDIKCNRTIESWKNRKLLPMSPASLKLGYKEQELSFGLTYLIFQAGRWVNFWP